MLPRYVRKFEDQGGFTAVHARLESSIQSVSDNPIQPLISDEPLVESLSGGVDASLGAAIGDQTGATLQNNQFRYSGKLSSSTYQEGGHADTETNSKSGSHGDR